MDDVCIVSGELDGDFAGEATFNDHGIVNAMETISWESSQKKADIRRDFSEESIYTYSDDELSKKKEVNSTGSRLYVPRLSNHSFPPFFPPSLLPSLPSFIF